MSYFEYNHVKAGYSKEMDVLHDVSFSLEKDDRIALIGANGAGKSTILKTISGIVKIREGSIIFKGEHLEKLASHDIVQRGVIQVPEEGGTFPNLSIEENLFISCQSKSSKVNRAKNMEFVYSMFPPLFEKSKQDANSLSGGQRKMLSIGKAIMADPEILLLDDISMGLAPKVVEDLYAMLKKLVEQLNKPVILVEQIVDIALDFAERGYVVTQGSIVMAGTSEELTNSDEVKHYYIG